MSVYEWDDNDHPLAYFITFRTHGTWLHGDRRGSVDRHGRNVFGSERIGLDPIYSVKMERNMTSEPVLLNAPMRVKVEEAIREVCAIRDYGLRAINVRTNHVHVVASAAAAHDTVMSAFKANATRELREAGLVEAGCKIWAGGGSVRYLWKPSSIEAAENYTINGQGDDLPNF